MKMNLAIVICSLSALLVGLWIGFSIHTNMAKSERGFIIREGQNKLVNPILACEIASRDSFTELKSTQSVLEKLIAQEKDDGEAQSISVYVRLLNSGRWIGINDEEKYTPASLMKVLLMFAFFKEAEDDPSIIKRELQFTNREEPAEHRTDGTLITDLTYGEFYSISQLIHFMIVDSSNAAEHLLLGEVNEKILREVLSDLGLPPLEKRDQQGLYSMSPMQYSLTFRVLFGASYLNKISSEKILELLAETTYKDGLAKKIPPEITVAHKFGLFSKNSESATSEKELHDCGIVYYPKHPYLLCIMTRGTDFGTLQSVIEDISLKTFEELGRFYKQE